MKIGVNVKAEKVGIAIGAVERCVFPGINEVRNGFHSKGDLLATAFAPLGRYG
jgi:hypothetical protein